MNLGLILLWSNLMKSFTNFYSIVTDVIEVLTVVPAILDCASNWSGLLLGNIASVWSWPRLISRCSASAAASSPSSSSSSASTSTGRRKRPETQRTRNFRFQKTFPGLRRGRCSENFRQKRFFKWTNFFLFVLLYQPTLTRAMRHFLQLLGWK